MIADGKLAAEADQPQGWARGSIDLLVGMDRSPEIASNVITRVS